MELTNAEIVLIFNILKEATPNGIDAARIAVGLYDKIVEKGVEQGVLNVEGGDESGN